MPHDNVLIIIPTYNEKENIGLIIPEIKALLPEAHILVVDDNSPDGTSAFVKEIAAKNLRYFRSRQAEKGGPGQGVRERLRVGPCAVLRVYL